MLIATLSYSKFGIPLQREELAAKSNISRKMFFVSAEGIDTLLLKYSLQSINRV